MNLESDIEELKNIVQKCKTYPLFPEPKLPEILDSDHREYVEEMRAAIEEYKHFNSLNWDEASPEDYNFSSEPFITMPIRTFLYLLPRMLLCIYGEHSRYPKVLDSLSFATNRLQRAEVISVMEQEFSQFDREFLIAVVKRVEEVIMGDGFAET